MPPINFAWSLKLIWGGIIRRPSIYPSICFFVILSSPRPMFKNNLIYYSNSASKDAFLIDCLEMEESRDSWAVEPENTLWNHCNAAGDSQTTHKLILFHRLKYFGIVWDVSPWSSWVRNGSGSSTFFAADSHLWFSPLSYLIFRRNFV